MYVANTEIPSIGVNCCSFCLPTTNLSPFNSYMVYVYLGTDSHTIAATLTGISQIL